MKRFAKRISRCTAKKFSGQGGGRFVELGYYDKDFVKNTRKRGPTGKHFGVLSPRYSQNYFLNGKFNPKVDTIRTFLSKIRTLFSIFKKTEEASTLFPVCATVSVAEYASISLNTPPV